MREYGSNMTLVEEAELDKECVLHALDGELICGETENGFEYEQADKEECREFVLSVIDKWYFLAKQLADSGRAVERLGRKHGFNPMNHFNEYLEELAEAENEFSGYVYENEKKDLIEEAEDALNSDN